MVKCVVLNGLIVDHRQNVCIKNYLGERLPRQFVAISFSFVIFDNFAFIFFQGLISDLPQYIADFATWRRG